MHLMEVKMIPPALFISHGSPGIALMPEDPTHRFLCHLAHSFTLPNAVVLFSAHWCSDHILISAADPQTTIHDFRGFDPRLYAMEYTPPGQPDLAREIALLLSKVDKQTTLVHDRGLDHGAWIPLMLMYPEATIPVVQVSIQPGLSPRYHYDLGAALSTLKQKNILIIGSGGMTHNLRKASFNDYNAPAPQWVSSFAEWMKKQLETGEKETTLEYRERCLYAQENHPTEEHLLPLFIAMGAGGEAKGQRIHTATMYGTVMTDAYTFTTEQ